MPKDSSDLKDTRPLLAKKADDARWKQANAYLKSNDFTLAKKALIELADYPNPYKLKATKLLKEIN